MVNSSAVESTEAAPGKTAGKEVTVLFCSHDFDRGFQYSKEACEALENVKASSQAGAITASNASEQGGQLWRQ